MSHETPENRGEDRRFFLLGGIGVLCAALAVARVHRSAVEREFVTPPASGVRVNVNTADAETLSLLRSIGPERARKIVEYRDRNGPFESYNELIRVGGIGEKTIEGLVEQVRFHD